MASIKAAVIAEKLYTNLLQSHQKNKKLKGEM